MKIEFINLNIIGAVLFSTASILFSGCGDVSAPSRAEVQDLADIKALRSAYAGPPETWPMPVTAKGQPFVEMNAVRPMVLSGQEIREAHLGEQLFFSTILSKNNDISCATCHEPQNAFSDKKRRSLGHDATEGVRHTPSLLGVGQTAPYFWDGRVKTLEEQALHPITNPIEMALTLKEMENRLQVDEAWSKAFAEAGFDFPVNSESVATALANYQRTFYRKTVFDTFIEGEKTTLTNQELTGLHLFRTKAQCMTCHNGPMLTDGQSHNIGLSYFGRRHEDLGEYEITGQAVDVGKFETPSLRHVSHTAPYMHVGFFPDLDVVLNVYNVGGFRPKARGKNAEDPLFPETTDLLEPLDLTKEEKAAIVAYLGTL